MLFFVLGMFNTIHAQNVVIEANVTSLRLSDGSDCLGAGSSDPRIWARVSSSANGWSSEWSFQSDDRGTQTGSNGYCLGGQTFGGSCGWTNQATWSSGSISANVNFQLDIRGFESDGATCLGDDGNLNYNTPYSIDRNLLDNWAPYCTTNLNTGTAQETGNSDGSSQTYFAGWNMRYYFTGLTDANAGGVTSGSSTICAGSTVALSVTEPLKSRYQQVNWQLNGSDISGATGASYTTPALAAGTYTYRRRSRYCTSFTGSVQDVYSTSFTITVQSTVNNPGAISVPATSCAGNAVNITNVTAATTGSPASSGPNYYFYYRGGPSNVGWTMYNGPTTSSTVALPTAVTNTPCSQKLKIRMYRRG